MWVIYFNFGLLSSFEFHKTFICIAIEVIGKDATLDYLGKPSFFLDIFQKWPWPHPPFLLTFSAVFSLVIVFMKKKKNVIVEKEPMFGSQAQ